MKNKKGFTLIELVIAIGLLSLFAVTIGITLTKNIKSQKTRELKEYNEKLVSSSNLYVSNNNKILNDLSTVKGFVFITIGDLISNGYLSENTINPTTNEKVDKNTKIKISYDANGTIKIDLENPTNEDYLQALDVYVNLGDNSIKDYCFYDLGKSTLTYVDKLGDFQKDYIVEKDNNGNYKNINCTNTKVDTTTPGTYRIIYNYKLMNSETWKRITRNIVIIDNIPPICNIRGNREANAAWRYEGLSDFNVGCSDNGGCQTVKQPSSPLINMATKDVDIYDKAGNKTTCTLYVYSDQIPPTCSQENVPSTWTNQNRTLSAKCTDSLSGCKENTITKTISTDTENTPVTVTDLAGNTTTCNLQALVDKAAPTTTLTSSTTSSTTPITLTGKAQDTLSGLVAYQFSTNSNITASSSGWNTITSTKELKTYTQEISSLGSSTWYFYSKDAAGNVGKSSATTITIESPTPNAPTLNISNPYQTRTGGTVRAEIKWTAGQNVTSYCVQANYIGAPDVNSTCWQTVSTSINETVQNIFLSGNPGRYYYVAYVKNSYNKISSVSNTSFGDIIDTTPNAPSLNLNPYSVPNGGTITANVSWIYGQNVNAFCVIPQNYSVSSCSWQSVDTNSSYASYSFPIYGEPGYYNYVAYVRNVYNEISPVSNASYGQIYATPPSAPSLVSNTYYTNAGTYATLTANWTSGQNVNAYCILPASDPAPSATSSCFVGSDWTSGSTTVYFASPGTYYYKAWVKNIYGLVSSESNTIGIQVVLGDVNAYGDKYYCWYVTYSNNNLIISTAGEVGTYAAALKCRDQPRSGTVKYSIYKLSTVTYDYFAEESVFTSSTGTHTYGWYHITSSTDPNGNYYGPEWNCYSALYYTAKDCSECVNYNQCTITKNPR